MTNRQLFFRHIAQTSAAPIALEIIKAKGSELFDAEGNRYLDLIAGISVSNVGHCNSDVISAIKKQADKYLHVLVYGEIIESPQVQYAKLLVDNLPSTLNSVYFTNSGAEATEGAMKLAKRYTGRTNIIAFNQSYHGSTQGALSLIGDEYWRNAYRPLLPGIFHVNYNSEEVFKVINEHTACVILEPVQAERGVVSPTKEWMQLLRQRCSDTGTLMVIDAIQSGFGRTGTPWGFEQYEIVPDVLLLGKALGGGMPLGAFIANQSIMQSITTDPVLGHITTFGGHPVSCAAGYAAFSFLIENKVISKVEKKSLLFQQLLKHKTILEVRSEGLLIAVEFDSHESTKKIVDACIKRGVLTDWFLFAPHCMRIAPPLIIRRKEIEKACKIILEVLDELA